MSVYTVIITRSAQKDLEQLPKQAQSRLIDAIYALADNPLPPGVKKLKGRQLQFRIRVGEYRVIYTIDGGALIVLVLKIGHRQSAYD